jgi:hypothetical protein
MLASQLGLQRRALLLTLALAAFSTTAAAAALHWLHDTDMDDAWIHLRVALNWANGLGPVYNAGERVEASTSPAWLALLALGIRLGADGPSLALFLGLVSTAATGAGAALLALRLGPKHARWAGLLAAVLTAGNITFTYWASTRMEVAFACALLLGSINLALVVERTASAVLLGLLAALTGVARPELISMVPVAIALMLLRAPRPQRLQLGLVAGGVALALLGAHLALRYQYYGQLVPNTYVAKVAGKSFDARVHSSLGVVRDFVLYQPLLLVPIGWSVTRGGVVRFLGLLCCALLAAVAWTGGDHFQYCRLAVPIVPIASALAACLLVELRRPFQLALALLLLLQAPFWWKRDGWRAVHSGQYVTQTHAVARALQRLPAGPVATLGIGVLGYDCIDRRIIDLVGLADAHIARTPHIPWAANGHDHSDASYVLSQAPAVVLPHILTTERALTAEEELRMLREDRYWYQSGLDLLEHPRFGAEYAPLNLALDNGRFIRVWTRRSLHGR